MRVFEKIGQRLLMGLLRSALGPLPALDEVPQVPQKILLVRADRIGDLVVSSGALAAVRRRFPDAELHLVVSQLNREVIRGNPAFDCVWEYRGWNLFVLLRQLRQHHFSLVIDWNTAYSTSSGLLVRFLDAEMRVSYDKREGDLFYNKRFPTEDKAHRVDEAMKIVRWLGCEEEALPYVVYPSAEDEAQAKQALLECGISEEGKRFAVHPGNIKKFDNRWPEEKFAALLDQLCAREGVQVLLLQGPGEEPLIADILGRMQAQPPVAPVLPLLTTAALLKKMTAVICNSTGTMHLAAAAGASTFAFLSGYGAACWRARGANHRALVGATWGSCRDITVAAAWQKLQELL
jgi:heptosyltransferase-3